MMINISSKLNQKAFTSLKSHNIKKRFNIWQEDKATGEIITSHISSDASTLNQVIEKAKDYQEYSDKFEKGKYIYHVDVEILIENSEGECLMEDGEIAYAITIFPEVNDFLEREIQ